MLKMAIKLILYTWHADGSGLIRGLDRHIVFGVKTWLSTLGQFLCTPSDIFVD